MPNWDEHNQDREKQKVLNSYQPRVWKESTLITELGLWWFFNFRKQKSTAMMEVEKSKINPMEMSTPPVPPARRLPPPLPPRKASTLDKFKFEAALKSAAEQHLETRSEGAPTPTTPKLPPLADIKPSEEPLSGNKRTSTPPNSTVDSPVSIKDSPQKVSADKSSPSSSSDTSPETDQPKAKEVNLSKQESLESEEAQLKESSSPIQAEPEDSKHPSPQQTSPRSSTSSPASLENVEESEQKRLSSTEKEEAEKVEVEETISKNKQDDPEDTKSLIPGN